MAIHAYTTTYVYTQHIHTCMHRCRQTCMHTYMHAYMQCIHTYMHTNIRKYIGLTHTSVEPRTFATKDVQARLQSRSSCFCRLGFLLPGRFEIPKGPSSILIGAYRPHSRDVARPLSFNKMPYIHTCRTIKMNLQIDMHMRICIYSYINRRR